MGSSCRRFTVANSPGHRPTGVLDPSSFLFLFDLQTSFLPFACSNWPTCLLPVRTGQLPSFTLPLAGACVKRRRPGAQSPLNHASAEVAGIFCDTLAACWSDLSDLWGHLKRIKKKWFFYRGKRQKNRESMAIGRLQIGFFINFRWFGEAFWHRFSDFSWASNLHRLFIIFYLIFALLQLVKIDFRSWRVAQIKVLQASSFNRIP